MKNFFIVFLFFSFLFFGCISLDSLFPSKPTVNSKEAQKANSENQKLANESNKSVAPTNSNTSNISTVSGSSPTKSVFINESINLTNTDEKNSEVLKPKLVHDILEIYFFDVGFGDSTLIRTKNSTILIGSGSESSSAALVEKLRALEVKNIDELILDSWLDTKIGGAKVILKRFPISRVWISKEIPNSFEAQEIYSLIKKNNILIYHPKASDKIKFEDLSIEVYNPQIKEYVNYPEANSIVLKIDYGKFCLFLPSDITQELEPSILSSLEKQTCTIYKWRKNGEGRSTPSLLFNNLEPKVVIISVGQTSRGEYPSKTTLTFISLAKADLYRTDIDKDIFINASKSGDYYISTKANLNILGQWYSSTDAS